MQSGLSCPSFCSRVSFVSWDILPCLVFHVLAAGPLANFRCDVPGSARLLAGRATTGRAMAPQGETVVDVQVSQVARYRY